MECSIIKNLDSLCRLCLVSGVELVDIFQDPAIVSKYGAESSVVYKIMVATNLEIRMDDELPHVICKTCSLKVSRSYEFRQQAKRSEEILRRYVQSKKYRMQVQGGKQPGTDEVRLGDYNSNRNGTAPNGNMVVEGIEIIPDNEFCLKDVTGDMDYSNNFDIGRDNGSDDAEEQSMILPVEPLLLDVEQDYEIINNGQNSGGEILDANFEPMWMDGGGVCIKAESELAECEEIEQLGSLVEVTTTTNVQETGENCWSCQCCNTKFTNEEKFIRHSLIHTSEPPFPCDYCDASFTLRTDLKAHWRVHSDGNPHVCQMCGKAYPDRSSYLKHCDVHDAVKPYHCPICEKSFCYGSDLRKHAITHTGVRPYVCSICGNAFTRSTSLNKHLRMHNGNRPFSCPSCPKIFGSKGDLKRHQLIHSGVKPWICTVCSVPFNRKDKLVRHERLHSGDPRPFACYECPTSFSRKEDLTKHIQFHHYKAPAIVNSKKDVEDAAALDKISTSDLERGNETFKLLLSEMNAHKSLVMAKQLVIGNDQNRKSIRIPLDQRTPRIETDNNNDDTQVTDEASADPQDDLKCDICHKHFDRRPSLNLHKKIHSNIKPFTCTVCEKSFYRRRELTRHEAVHTGYKPYSCGVCGRCFSRTDKLNRHVQTHEYKSMFRNITCDVCSLNFRTEQEFANHKSFCCPDQVENLDVSNMGNNNNGNSTSTSSSSNSSNHNDNLDEQLTDSESSANIIEVSPDMLLLPIASDE